MTSTPISEAKLTANRLNAQLSPRPRTEEGKARVSRNAVSFGLFSTRDFVRPEETEDYKLHREGLLLDFNPEGVLELAHAAEILTATWRLRRCGILESGMSASDIDPMANPETAKLQVAIDRARIQAYNILRRATAELERLQARRTPKPVEATPAPPTIQTHHQPERDANIARNALCPCESGQKYKRCCGINAPAILNQAA